MGNVARISRSVLAAIARDAAASPDREICGLVFGDGREITGHRACANVAADPATRFEIDPAALIAAHRGARGAGAPIAGCYHSHPTGRAEPSPRDAADAAPDGWLWLIAAPGGVSAWRAVPDGPVHGRFERVEIHAVEGR